MDTPFNVSPATPADYTHFARLFPELEVPDRVPSAEHFTHVIAPLAIFARDGAAVVGYASARARGDRLHVVHVITDPAHRRRGVGRALMNALAERARAEGFHRWMLNVKPENVAARELYARFGMREILSAVSLQLAWADVAKLPAPIEGTTTRALGITDDPRFENALALDRGDLTSCRATPGRVFVGAEDRDGGVVGCAAFDPAFPGAPVLRAVTTAHARALLEAIRPHALPDHDGLFVFVEGAPALEADLFAAGARVMMRALRMEGPLADAQSLSSLTAS
jgi:GNAT superfamily N-acetyltransferase